MESVLKSQIIDSEFFGEDYCTEESKEIFSDIRRMQRWLDIEKALLKSQKLLGLIPEEAADELINAGELKNFDLDKIKSDIKVTKHSLIPLLNAWQRSVSSEAAQYIHYGPTTQDIEDTAQMLEVKDILKIVKKDLKSIIDILIDLSRENQNVAIVGRTHAQNALPMSLGLKFAEWLDENIRNYRRVEHCEKNLLVSQLFGGVGTMASFQGSGYELLKVFSEELGLGVPNVAWHNTRDRFVELLSVLALITGNFAKIANEIIQLNKNGIEELSEPFSNGQVGSSTMPHKRNPEKCEHIVTLAKLVKGNTNLNFDTLECEHERDYRSLRLEWVTITDTCMYACCALKSIKEILSGLVINHENINKNLMDSAELISSEAIMFWLGKQMGKNKAHKAVYETVMNKNKDKSLVDELVQKYSLDEKELRCIVDPKNSLGESGKMIEKVILDAKTIK
ncbi:class-II fumarase/aspartase family protein [Anaerosacchariphilus polymeriproducens]|uniref:Adenylosuccinate lyase family protein n=1 Tax=Anaerosacchariphilus polymeriproducens TaxID=1812858 RepID=A0A371AXU9_9FIRM|nr:adenylosuccinate lyase family protein [Anaerosacchariphilus polymeriproducens]RDU24404.1 adenylosuccinate lyase family protein [Anaerosacchariphilus polymeriproducens]